MSYEPDYAGGGAYEAARQKVSAPGIFLVVIGVLNLLAGLLLLYGGFVLNRTPTADFERWVEQQLERSPEQKRQWEDLKQQGVGAEAIKQFYTNVALVWGVAAVLAALVTIFGGIRMAQLRSYGLAVIGAILAAIPLLSPLACPFILGLPIGIWALVVLFDSRVKAGFGGRPEPRYEEDYRDRP